MHKKKYGVYGTKMDFGTLKVLKTDGFMYKSEVTKH